MSLIFIIIKKIVTYTHTEININRESLFRILKAKRRHWGKRRSMMYEAKAIFTWSFSLSQEFTRSYYYSCRVTHSTQSLVMLSLAFNMKHNFSYFHNFIFHWNKFFSAMLWAREGDCWLKARKSTTSKSVVWANWKHKEELCNLLA